MKIQKMNPSQIKYAIKKLWLNDIDRLTKRPANNINIS